MYFFHFFFLFFTLFYLFITLTTTYYYTTCLLRFVFHLCRKMYCITPTTWIVNVSNIRTCNCCICLPYYLHGYTRLSHCAWLLSCRRICLHPFYFALNAAVYAFDIWMLLLAPYRHNNSTVSATCGNKYNAICLCLLCVEFWKAKSGLFLFLFLSRTKTMICFMFHLCICI